MEQTKASAGKWKTILILLLICVLIAVIPLAINKDSEFGGADGAAEDAISEIDPDYEVWASPVLEPPGGETESLLFCLQAAIGSGVFFYFFGVMRERHRREKEAEDKQKESGKSM
ncbi:energy-coupling factor ABC transporter substrate-binding protein [Qiania dongpingensis]|uniref:Cobalt transport protein CbiN n=2 Tax=Qiania dongpingensis TaxID=2763669 RepID=A0A7G9G7X4_9FIRM|nr:energy-coupling factor ABC transporter substrate-binding protein [Qiania dongpingensis]